MDLDTMTFEELLFHGRYGIIGAILFLVFFVVFVREAVREFLAARAERRSRAHEGAYGPVTFDRLVGPTMADGGEPSASPDDPTRR